jgi:hypothetical protein
MLKMQKKSNDAVTIRDGIQKLLEETTTFKEIIRKNLLADPENPVGHRMYCDYVRRILEIHKTRLQALSLDPEQLLMTVLKSVVKTLLEKGETGASETVGQHLEAIGENVRKQWQDHKEPDKAIRKSEPSSRRRSLPSGTKRRRKSKNASPPP